MQFNNASVPQAGNYTLVIDYLNGDPVRKGYLSINGGDPQEVTYLGTGSFWMLGTLKMTIPLKAGVNTIKLFNPNINGWMADIDLIQILP